MRALVFLGLFVLASCTSQMMNSYIGKSIKEPMLDYGPPINIIELDDGRRAYQWQVITSGMTAVSGPTTTTYIPYSDSCIHTLTAKKTGDDYIVDGYRKTSFFCE
ncbi:hypothetical protein [Thalassospira lucentensis]|uniref:hypothetical protein n=1 Tax=Thalassospira lucentensis TaxID=168935 RepID=UPI003AA7B556